VHPVPADVPGQRMRRLPARRLSRAIRLGEGLAGAATSCPFDWLDDLMDTTNIE
jgi:hypothetical protein